VLRAVLIASFLAAASQAVRAEAPGTLTLTEAVRMARGGNLTLEAAREDYEAAKWGLRSARASLFPSISLSSTARRIDPDTYKRSNASIDFFADEFGAEIEPFVYETTYETSFNASMPIWNGGKLWGAVGAASGARDAAYHAYRSTARSVAVDVEEAYLGVLRAQALLRVSEEAVDAAEANVDAAQRKFDVGLVSRAELLRWRVALAQDRQALTDAESAVFLARTALADVLGAPLDMVWTLADVEPAELELARIEYAEFLDGPDLTEERARELLTGNPDLQALKATTKISGSSVTAARGAFFPALNAAASYGWKADDDIEPDDETAWSVTLALEFPIFTSFANWSGYQESRRAHLAAEARRGVGERGLVAGLRNASAMLRLSFRALEAAEQELEQAREHQKNVAGRYEQGLAPYTEFVDAKVLLDRARVGHVNALYDCFIATAEMDRFIGDDDSTTGAE
jgi:outer membrane protein TolC